MSFYGVDSSGNETEDRKTYMMICDAIDAMPEWLPGSFNVSASVDLKSAKLFVPPAS